MEDLAGNLCLSEGLIIFFDKVFQVKVKISLRRDDFLFIRGQIIMLILTEFFQLVNTVEKNLVKLEKVLFLFSVKGCFLLFEELFIFGDIFVHFCLPFLFYIIEVVLFRGRHRYFWLALLFCLCWCLFVLAHLCFLIVQEFQDSLFVNPLAAILDSNVFSRGSESFFGNGSTVFLELGNAGDFGGFVGIGVEWDFDVVGVRLLHV